MAISGFYELFDNNLTPYGYYDTIWLVVNFRPDRAKEIETMKKVIFENPEVCNFGEQGVWFGEVSDSFDNVVTDRNVTTEAEALEWLKENYVGEFEVIIHQ